MNTMGKEANLDGLEFDGDTVLCRVCGDKASGFHYGVHACEGCKGFFRRSIQQKIQYRPCLKNQQCNIMRVNRNRCQYCRLKKCISVGMSRDAVRFGRVPKKEKARIIEQMQRVNSQSQSNALASLLLDEQDVVHAVISSHQRTCDLSLGRVSQMRDQALQLNNYVNCPANMACPLNNHLAQDANKNDMDDFSESFTPSIKSVVDFAKGITGFSLLNQDDQVTLLKAGTFEVLLVRLACLFDPDSSTMMFTGGRLFRRHASTIASGAGFLLDSMFDFAERFNKLCLRDEELALFSAIVLLSPDRPGLRNLDQVERIQNKLTEALQNMINLNHKDDTTLFAKLLMKTTDLRTLNTLHSEKSIGQTPPRYERRERHNTEESDMDFQESMSVVSGRSSPTPSEVSNMTMTSGSFSDSCSLESGSLGVRPQRIPLEAAAHQQVVLRTPYGTFYREEMSGFYGLVADQPRRRCNTLDRDTLTSRPRLHTIEEGNRRRYTMDKEYINKMVNRLSDKLEARTAIRGDSVPPSISSSAASSPIPEEYGSAGNFVPISTPEQTMAITRASPVVNSETLMAQAYGSSPSSPRPRSGSFGTDDYQQRRRCFSFHLNSEGRASRQSLHQKMMAERERHSPESQHYMSVEQRRGSVGAACGLHARKRSLLVDRHPSYLSATPDGLRQSQSVDKRMMPSAAGVKHMVGEVPVYGRTLTPNSLSPNMFQRRAVMPPSSVGFSSPSSMLSQSISPQGSDNSTSSQSDIMPPPLSKVEECVSMPLAAASPNKDGDRREMAAPSTQTLRGGSPHQESDMPNETFGHKKFDKFRKSMMLAAGDEVTGSARDLEAERVKSLGAIQVDVRPADSANPHPLTSLLAQPDSSDIVDGMGDGQHSNRSAKDAHPNLLAFLNSPAGSSGTSPPSSSFVPPPPSSYPGYPWHAAASPSKDASSNTSTIPSTLAAQLSGSTIMDRSSKEQVHAATVTNLKEKLMRKFDSSENLHRLAATCAASAPMSTVPSSISENDVNRARPQDSQAAHPHTFSVNTNTVGSNSISASNPTPNPAPQQAANVMLPPNLPPNLYHSMLNSHYSMQGIKPPAITTQHLAGLQHQFAQLLASSNATHPSCPVSSAGAQSPHAGATASLSPVVDVAIRDQRTNISSCVDSLTHTAMSAIPPVSCKPMETCDSTA